MQIRNGIRIEPKRIKPKRKNAPNFKLGSKTMIHPNKGSITLPNFGPVLDFMERNGYK